MSSSSIEKLSACVDDILTRAGFLDEPLETVVKDTTVNPSYYNHSAHQPIETMEANMSVQQFVGYLRGNIIKYACRMGKKETALKDARKLAQYASWLEKVLSGGYISPSNDPSQKEHLVPSNTKAKE
nr:MAG TPA: nucelotide kinase [Caudoviricetes sp.]